MLAFHLGVSIVGIQVHDGMRLVDYLQTRVDLDTSRLDKAAEGRVDAPMDLRYN